MSAEVRKNDETGRWNIKNPESGRWMTPVTLDGELFPSMGAAGVKIGVTAGGVSAAVRDGREIAGLTARLPTEKAVREFAASLDQKSKKRVRRRRRHSSNGHQRVFEGVKWDNGDYTIRCQGWTMTRGRLSEFPEEMLDACAWKK